MQESVHHTEHFEFVQCAQCIHTHTHNDNDNGNGNGNCNRNRMIAYLENNIMAATARTKWQEQKNYSVKRTIFVIVCKQFLSLLSRKPQKCNNTINNNNKWIHSTGKSALEMKSSCIFEMLTICLDHQRDAWQSH